MYFKLRKKQLIIILVAFLAAMLLEGIAAFVNGEGIFEYRKSIFEKYPEYDGKPYAVINGGVPYFNENEKSAGFHYEYYGELDEYGRCTQASACLSRETMPIDDRADISEIRPTGWHSIAIDSIEGGYLYNRCHLIGYQLSGENANEKNLITGTRYMNVEGMQPFENKVADYIKETGKRVRYRVTPVFRKDELLARGVYIEAYSVDDAGEGICFCVFVYNVQPGVKINYKTGESIKIS